MPRRHGRPADSRRRWAHRNRLLIRYRFLRGCCLGTPRDRRLYVAAYDDEIAAADIAFDDAATRILRWTIRAAARDRGDS